MKIESIIVPIASAVLSAASAAVVVSINNRRIRDIESNCRFAEVSVKNEVEHAKNDIKKAAEAQAKSVVSQEFKDEIHKIVSAGYSKKDVELEVEEQAKKWVNAHCPGIVTAQIRTETRKFCEQDVETIVKDMANQYIRDIPSWKVADMFGDAIHDAISDKVDSSVRSYDIRDALDKHVKKVVEEEAKRNQPVIVIKEV